MPIASPELFKAMLDKAKQEGHALPAINVSSITSANAALKGLAQANCDGIVQVSIGAGSFASGLDVANPALGAISIAQHVHLVADQYPVYIGLSTDHCVPGKIETFLRPLFEATKKNRALNQGNLFNLHMFDGSELPLDENMNLAKPLAAECHALDIFLEVETGVVGGEEDGIDNQGIASEKLYTSAEDMVYVYEALAKLTEDKFLLAATFGNVHGVYKPGNVTLKPQILKQGADALAAKYGQDASLKLVFHGGSGSDLSDIHQAIDYGVVKMNIDTDTQYAFTRAIAEHMFRHYDGVLKIDSEVGDKKQYDPRAYLKKAEAAMAQRVYQAAKDLRALGKSLYKA